MKNIDIQLPASYEMIRRATDEQGFTMASDLLTGSLLRTLSASITSGMLLELGTGTGLSTSWILEGMTAETTLISIENDAKVLSVARQFLGADHRLTLVEQDASEWLATNQHLRFKLIFADTWYGKYLMFDEFWTLLEAGGIYVLDDMLPQANWPQGHEEKVEKLLSDLEKRNDLVLTQLDWSTGILIAVKR